MAQKSGDAAPTTAAQEEIGDDILSEAAGKFGINIPKAADPEKKPAKSNPEDDGKEEDTPDAGDEADADKDSDEAKDDAKDADDETAAEDGADDEVEAAADAAAKLASETKQFVAVKLKDLPEELRSRVTEVVNKRIGKISADAKAEQARLETRVEELTEELEETKAKGGGESRIQIPGLHPLFLANSEADIEQRISQIEQFEDFADQYRDGYEGDGTPQNPTWSAEQIRAKLRELQREREKIIPAARANLAARAAKDAELKKTFPALFDRKSEEYRRAQALGKLMPELRRHPDMNALIARLILGEKALAQLGKATATPTKSAAQTVKKAPRVPGSGGSAKGSVVDRNADNRPVASDAVKKVMQRPGDKQAFTSAVGALIGDL